MIAQKPARALLLVTSAALTTLVFGQAKSALQFYDSTGTNKTVKFGWTGGTTDGHFYIVTPMDGEAVSVKGKDLTVSGSLSATSLSGDGSNVTNVPLAQVTGLSSELNLKADKNHPHVPADIVGKIKADSIENGGLMINSAGDAGKVWKSTGDGRGAWANDNVGNGTIAAVNPGAGLTGSTSGGAVSLGVAFGGSGTTFGTKDSVARSDHSHDVSAITGTFPGSQVGTGINASNITTGTLSGSRVGSGVNGANITTGTIDAHRVSTDFRDQKVMINSGFYFYAGNSSIPLFGMLSSAIHSGVDTCLIWFKPQADGTDDGSIANRLFELNRNTKAATFMGSVAATAFTQSSDLRFKQNVQTYENALQKICKLRGVRFDWRQKEFPGRGFTSDHQIGLIAQEVEKEIPEVVKTDGSGYKSVEYANIVSVLVQAVKEQQAVIDSQKIMILDQQKNIQSNQNAMIEIQKRVAEIEKTIAK
jgi:hypothetical protein